MKKLILILFIFTASLSSRAQEGKEFDKKPAQDTEQQAKLPPAVIATLEKEFPGYIIKWSRKHETSAINTAPYYEVQVEKGKSAYTVEVDQEGKVLKKTEVTIEAKQPGKEY